ncbi:MAG: hypothetical protein FJX60_16840 [Alphaproteobacteria bacterium]|nr:hypothetical protein [Alphaproteobacteria bacterium]
MNLDRPEFRDKEVRKALGLALNREGMARSIMRDPTVAAPQVFAPSMPGWHVAASEPFRQDQAAARRALDAAGWAVGADGVRTKDGRRLAFELISYTSRPEIPVAATVVQADLKAVGVDVAIRSAEWTIVPEAQKDGSLQAALMSRGYSLVADPIPLILADFARDRTEWGAMNWRNDEFRTLGRTYLATFEEADRARLRKRMAEILLDEMPVMPLIWTPLTVAVSKRVENVVIDPYEMRYLIDRVRFR